MRKSNLERRQGLFHFTTYPPLCREVRAETLGRSLEVGTKAETQEERCLLPCLPMICSVCFLVCVFCFVLFLFTFYILKLKCNHIAFPLLFPASNCSLPPPIPKIYKYNLLSPHNVSFSAYGFRVNHLVLGNQFRPFLWGSFLSLSALLTCL